MKYLFFDIETITAESINPRIVSFGYVLTDEQFNEIDKGDIFINPLEETQTTNYWKWKQDVTKDKEGFKASYHKIKSLLEDKCTVIVGHGTNFDVQYLADECDRFHFEPIDFDYLDTKIIADILLDSNVPKNLKGLHEHLCPAKNDYQWHRSLDDAYMTKDVFVALLAIAKNQNINVLANERLTFNSLRCVYGGLADIAKKDDEYFSCNFDMPIITLKTTCNYIKDGRLFQERYDLHYDYAIDKFFAPKHPKAGMPRDPKNGSPKSQLPDEAYEIATKRAVYKINKMWNDAAIENNPLLFFYKEGCQLADLKINHIFHNVTSYEVFARYNNDFLEFDFKIPLSCHYLKNAIDCRKDMTIDMKRIITRLHNLTTATHSMLLMAKMKFGYKDKTFPTVQTEEVCYSENIRYLLPKEYARIKAEPGTQKGAGDTLLHGNKMYIPTEHAFENNLFPERLMLPVLAEKTQ